MRLHRTGQVRRRGLFARTILSPLWWDDRFERWGNIWDSTSRIRYGLLGLAFLLCLGAALLWGQQLLGRVHLLTQETPRRAAPAPPRRAVVTTLHASAVLALVVEPQPAPPATVPPPVLPNYASGTPGVASPSPLATPVATPAVATPAATPRADQVQRRVAEQLAGLRSGSLEAIFDYGSGTSSSVQFQFTLDSDGAKGRAVARSTYRGNTGERVEEQLRSGSSAWKRSADGVWTPQILHDSVGDWVRSFLPSQDSIAIARIETTGGVQTLYWYDAALDADCSLEVATATGQPQRFVRKSRVSGAAVRIVYSGWNIPVVLPDAPR